LGHLSSEPSLGFYYKARRHRRTNFREAISDDDELEAAPYFAGIGKKVSVFASGERHPLKNVHEQIDDG